MRGDALRIRHYTSADLGDVYDVCVRTSGAGGRERRLTCPKLVADVFAGPYLMLHPELAFVAEGPGGVAGYVLGVADTAAFVAEYRERWLPRMAGYPRAGLAATPDDAELIGALRRPEGMLAPKLSAWPAHLHVNLLPAGRGAGNGRALVSVFLAAVRAAGAPAVHLAVAETNTNAHGFYERLGFTRIEVAGGPGVRFYGRPTAG